MHTLPIRLNESRLDRIIYSDGIRAMRGIFLYFIIYQCTLYTQKDEAKIHRIFCGILCANRPKKKDSMKKGLNQLNVNFDGETSTDY